MAHVSGLTKSELCHALGWSKPRLDRRLADDTNFPVRKRGTQAGGWEFDLPIVLAYLGNSSAGPRRGRPVGAKPAAASKPADTKPEASVEHSGEATAKQRKDHWAAAALEDNVRRKRRDLIEAEEMRIVLSGMLVTLNKGLDSLRDTLMRDLRLRDEDGDKIETILDQLRRGMVAELQTLLS